MKIYHVHSTISDIATRFEDRYFLSDTEANTYYYQVVRDLRSELKNASKVYNATISLLEKYAPYSTISSLRTEMGSIDSLIPVLHKVVQITTIEVVDN